MAEEQIAPNESGIDGATKEERDVRDRADNLFRPVLATWDIRSESWWKIREEEKLFSLKSLVF